MHANRKFRYTLASIHKHVSFYLLVFSWMSFLVRRHWEQKVHWHSTRGSSRPICAWDHGTSLYPIHTACPLCNAWTKNLLLVNLWRYLTRYVSGYHLPACTPCLGVPQFSSACARFFVILLSLLIVPSRLAALYLILSKRSNPCSLIRWELVREHRRHQQWAQNAKTEE